MGDDVEVQCCARKEHTEGIGVGDEHPAVEAYENRSEDLEGDGLDFTEETTADGGRQNDRGCHAQATAANQRAVCRHADE